jgi:hypothetical protein
MTRGKRFALIAVATLGAVYLFSGLFRGTMLGALVGTTTDPRSLGLVQSGSLQPIEVGLHTQVYRDKSGSWHGILSYGQPPWLEGDSWPKKTPPGGLVDTYLRFRVPAASLDFLRGYGVPLRSESVGFKLWSETMEPVAYDLMRELAKCPRVPARCEPANDLFKERAARGEYALRFSLSAHVTQNKATIERNRLLIAGLHPEYNTLKRPCETYDDLELGMTVTTVPEGVNPGKACEFDHPGMRGSSGQPNPGSRLFLKRYPDERPKFSVKCGSYNPDPNAPINGYCNLSGMYGHWLMFIDVENRQAEKWDAAFDRAVKFLDDHTTARFEPNE